MSAKDRRWLASMDELSKSPPMEAIEGLHHTFVKNRALDPANAMASAEAILELARSDPGGQLIRFVRRLTRDGHDILELALERMESAGTPEGRREAQRLFDDTLQTIAVP